MAHTYIGNFFIRGISGGQRKRVGIGCELVVSPTLLFLDEPTSGLDAAAAYHVMNVVHQLCTVKNRCVSGFHCCLVLLLRLTRYAHSQHHHRRHQPAGGRGVRAV